VPVPRRFDRRPPERDTTRINERIRVPQVRLIGADGEQLGIVDTNESVETRPGGRSRPGRGRGELETAGHPPARLLEVQVRAGAEAEAARKHQQQVNIREIKLRPKIATHDYETKKGHVERFLRHNDKVKVDDHVPRREQAHPSVAGHCCRSSSRTSTGWRRSSPSRCRKAAT